MDKDSIKGKELKAFQQTSPHDDIGPVTRALDDIRKAFLQAQKDVGREWQMKGRGHTKRASVNPRTGQAISNLNLVRAQIRDYSFALRTAYPRTLVERAAEILGVRFEDLAGVIQE
jgi:hypothetical protein